MNKKPTAEESKIAFSELTKKFYIVHKDGSKKDVTEWFDKHANNAVEEHKLRLRDKINKRVKFLTAEGGSSQLDRASGLIECLEFLNNKD